MELKKIRIEKGLTQEQAAKHLNITRRTYAKYEKESSRQFDIKYKYMCNELSQIGMVNEEKGILRIEEIETICKDVFIEYGVEYAYLFGSYAKGKAIENSDIDLLVSIPINGLKFFELIETLREKLKKKIDLLDVSQLNNNRQLLEEILKDGIKIYG